MNKYGLTHLGAMIPEQVYRTCQACAAREGVPLPVWVRTALFRAAQVSESDIANLPPPVTRLTPARRAILTFLETHEGYQTTAAIAGAMSLAHQTVYNTLSDLRREGLIQRGENVASGQGAGAPYKAYAISEIGRNALTTVREATRLELEHLNAVTTASYAELTAPIRAQADKDQFQGKLHTALRYVAMARLGRAIESEADITWLEGEHKRLTGLADADVASGAATFEAHYKAVMGRIETLGGFEAISEKFNVG